MQDFSKLPPNLPVPIDDGAGKHLFTQSLPDIALSSTDNSSIKLSDFSGWQAVFCYPLTADPKQPLPKEWDLMPGARGCTPQACSIRDEHAVLTTLGVQVFGLSTQTTSYQQAVVERLHLPYPLLSDHERLLMDSLKLPYFLWQGQRLNKRLTLIAHNGKIQHVFYPVFPPDQHIHQVIHWLQTHV